MLAVSDKYKQNIDSDERNCRAYLQFLDSDVKITDEYDLESIEWTDNIIDDSFIGSFVKKEYKAMILNTTTQYNFDNAKLNFYTGLEYDDGTTEYIFQGTLIVTEYSYDNVNKEYTVTLNDMSLLFENKFSNIGFEFPMTRGEYVKKIAETINVESDETFNLSTKILKEQPFLDTNSNFSDAIRQVAQACMCTAKMSANKLKFNLLNRTDKTADITINDFFDLSTTEKIGPYNVLVLARTPQEDNEYYPKPLPENPVEFRIENNYLVDPQVSGSDNRSEEIVDMYPGINGFEYLQYSVTLLKGHPELESCDWISFYDMEDVKQTSPIFCVKHKFDGSFSTTVSCEFKSSAKTNYKRANTINDRVSNTEIAVDKANEKITSLVSTTTALTEEAIKQNNNYQDVINRIGDLATEDSLIQLENTVKETITNTQQSFEVIEKILVDGVEAVNTKTGVIIDKKGISVEKTNAETKTNINENGMIIESKVDGTNLLTVDKNGVVAENVKVNNYLTIGKNSRIEDYTDEDNKDATGVFWIGGVSQ